MIAQPNIKISFRLSETKCLLSAVESWRIILITHKYITQPFPGGAPTWCGCCTAILAQKKAFAAQTQSRQRYEAAVALQFSIEYF